MYQINVTSVLPITFVPGVNLHLTESSVIRIKEICTEAMKNVKDDDGIVAVFTALESIIGSRSGASARGKELHIVILKLLAQVQQDLEEYVAT